jgi:hypothetical protein
MSNRGRGRRCHFILSYRHDVKLDPVARQRTPAARGRLGTHAGTAKTSASSSTLCVNAAGSLMASILT